MRAALDYSLPNLFAEQDEHVRHLRHRACPNHEMRKRMPKRSKPIETLKDLMKGFCFSVPRFRCHQLTCRWPQEVDPATAVLLLELPVRGIVISDPCRGA